ncbi:hypothetical protein PsYK624_094930 [Phanerochaete sordida]|uniref:MYND-type domain-containing protein n=1 Tax=Phanerochaete sordida TaxID=48140 RepID=A0A9P3GGQ4_9APHY|nr:hypothetical protein PsYK624_094930 [Phanerochaete sordida]
MLALWDKLFPGDFSQGPLAPLSRDDMLDRVLQVPDLWTQLMRELYTGDFDPDSIWTPATTLAEAVKQAPEAAWRTAWRSGFVAVLEQGIRNSYLCGFTHEQLVTAQNPRRVGRCALMLDLFLACAERVLSSKHQEEVSVLLNILQDTVVGVFVKLWDVRDPFLIAQPASSVDARNNSSNHPMNYLYGLHVTLDKLGDLMITVLSEHRNFDFINSHIPHISLVIWLHSPVAKPLRDPPWVEFFCSADLGFVGDEQVAQGILRDLGEETVVDDRLAEVLNFFGEWQDMYAGARESLPLEPRFASYCLGAARRQLCQGNRAEPTGSIATTTAVLRNLRPGSLTSSRQCYAFLDLLCRFLKLYMQMFNDAAPPLLNTYTHWILQQLHRLGKDVRPKSAAMRRHTLQEWQAISDEIARRQLARRSDGWLRFARAWQVVHGHLLPEPGEVQWTPFGAFERCAWGECLCSRHKPAHRMRVCRGCERVVYCGKRCQRSDWEDGGHRSRCRRET